MADKIPAGAPRAPQIRRQIMDEHGTFHAIPDIPQKPSAPGPEGPTIHPFQIGDAVTLTGRVLEVQNPQGGQMSVKVQTPQGATWFRGEHIQLAGAVEDDGKDAQIVALANELDAAIGKAAYERQVYEQKIADLEAALMVAVPAKK